MKILFSILYLASCVFLPWYLSVALAVILIAYFNLWPLAIIGGLLMDIAFGAPLPILFNFAYFYMALFALLALFEMVLRQRMLE